MKKSRNGKESEKHSVRTRADRAGLQSVAYQNKDITSKVLAEHFKGKTFRVYGLNIPEIRAVLPTNIPAVKVNELRLDNLFELMDGTVAIVDYESEYKEEDKVKYLNYLTGIANRYIREKRACPALRMIVIYTGDISRRQVSDEYNIGAVKVTLEPAFLSELDVGGIFRQLKNKVEKNEVLDDEELMKFIILPLAYQRKEEKERKIQETVKLAARIQDRNQQLFTLAGILAFTDKVIDGKTADEIRRVIEMTQVARIFEEEKQQALAELEKKIRQELEEAKEEKHRELKAMKEEKRRELKAMKEEKRRALKAVKEEKRRELEAAEEEKRCALKAVKEEKHRELEAAEEEKRRALKAVEEEKQQALAELEEKKYQAARGSVIRMLERNYPSDEISFIVPDFSLEEIEKVRKEIRKD